MPELSVEIVVQIVNYNDYYNTITKDKNVFLPLIGCFTCTVSVLFYIVGFGVQ